MWRDKLDFIFLVGISVLFIPFFRLSSTIDPVLTPRFFVWSITCLVLIISFVIQLCISSKNIDCSILRRIIFPVFCAYLLFSIISFIKAVNITEGVYEVLKILVSAVYLFIATIILSKNKNYIPALAKVVIVSVTTLSLIGIYEYFTRFFPKHGMCHITGTMAHRNQFSSALFLMLPFCLYSCLCSKTIWRIISVIPIVLGSTLILLNQTRSVWVGFLVSTIATTVVIVFFFKKLKVSKEIKSQYLKGLLCITIILVIVLSTYTYLCMKSNSIDSLVQRVESFYSSSVTVRTLLWQKSLEVIKDNVIFGVGAGNWRIVIPSYSVEVHADAFLGLHYQRPHNDYIWVLSEIGILGFIFYLLIFGVIIFYIFKILIHQSNTNDKLLSTFIFFGIVGYMTISFFTFPKERIFHSMFLLLMMAIVISIYHRSSDNLKNIPRPFMFMVGIPAIVLLLFATFIGYTRLNAEIHTKRAFEARRVQNWQVVISEIDKGYSVFATLDPTSAPLYWYRGEANFLLNNTKQALADFKKAYKAHPYHLYVLNNFATCYEMTGNHNQAINYYNKALEIYPEYEDALINLGAAYYNAGRYDLAYEVLSRSNAKSTRLRQYLEAVRKKNTEK